MTTDDRLHIGDFSFSSRLFAGTGRHRSNEELVSSVAASGAEVVTVAIRRLNLGNPARPTLLAPLAP
ncbi:MAG: thiazole synthase, partial [Chloroflexi bacterium]|nr:thiazole synthase [Chloroflexota bacterium]